MANVNKILCFRHVRKLHFNATVEVSLQPTSTPPRRDGKPIRPDHIHFLLHIYVYSPALSEQSHFQFTLLLDTFSCIASVVCIDFASEFLARATHRMACRVHVCHCQYENLLVNQLRINSLYFGEATYADVAKKNHGSHGIAHGIECDIRYSITRFFVA